MEYFNDESRLTLISTAIGLHIKLDLVIHQGTSGLAWTNYTSWQSLAQAQSSAST